MELKEFAKLAVMSCKTPGKKIRSKGMGRGLARGEGKGPIGIPYYQKLKKMKENKNV